MMSEQLAMQLRDMYTSTYKALDMMSASMLESARLNDYDGVLRTLAAMHDIASLTHMVGSSSTVITDKEHGA